MVTNKRSKKAKGRSELKFSVKKDQLNLCYKQYIKTGFIKGVQLSMVLKRT